MPSTKPTVYIHIGLPKTGTTHLQEVLWIHRGTAESAGLLYPGYVHSAHFHAAVDLQRDRYPTWVGVHTDRAWERLVEHVRGYPRRAVISSELLAPAPESVVQRILADLSFAEVHLVCTARDLARQIPSTWQENIKTCHSTGFTNYLDVVRAGDHTPISHAFWASQDLTRVLRTWGAALPPDHVHVVTVPPSGSPKALLWNRFAEALGIDGSRFDPTVNADNASLGMVQAELLRRLNLALDGKVDWPRYSRVVKELIAAEILSTRNSRGSIALPDGHFDWVRRNAELTVTALREAGYRVHGSLDDLLPTPTGPEPRVIATVTDTDLLDEAVTTLAQLVEKGAALPAVRSQIAGRLLEITEHHPPLMRLRHAYWRGRERALRARLRSR